MGERRWIDGREGWTRIAARAALAPACLAAVLAAAPATGARAALAVGAAAPLFDAPASLGGREFRFSLADALRRGPVVLYFYPAAFTSGCTAEAHDFAEATAKFASLGATVIGVSTDRIATLDRFSVDGCRSKFAVAADPDGRITHLYKSALLGMAAYANRTSYVITPDDTVLYDYTALDPDRHVGNTMTALQDWEKSHPAAATPAAGAGR